MMIAASVDMEPRRKRQEEPPTQPDPATNEVSRGDKRIEEMASRNNETMPADERPASLEVYDREYYGTQALPPVLIQQVAGAEEKSSSVSPETLGREYLEAAMHEPEEPKSPRRKKRREAATEAGDVEPREDQGSPSGATVPADADPHYASHTENEIREVRER